MVSGLITILPEVTVLLAKEKFIDWFYIIFLSRRPHTSIILCIKAMYQSASIERTLKNKDTKIPHGLIESISLV